MLKTNRIELKIFYLISMPIGHLKDISFRGKETLENTSTIIVEEYRAGKKILEQLGINFWEKKILVLNEHIERPGKLSNRYCLGVNKKNKTNLKKLRTDPNDKQFMDMFKELLGSSSAALICDAGAPILADPGFRLLEKLRHYNVRITHISGASSLISGLLLSGFNPDSFYYVGFLPQKKITREKILKGLSSFKELLVIMETPYRLSSLLQSLGRTFPHHTQISITFSLTQEEEEIYHGYLKEAIDKYLYSSKNRQPFILFLNNRGNKIKF